MDGDISKCQGGVCTGDIERTQLRRAPRRLGLRFGDGHQVWPVRGRRVRRRCDALHSVRGGGAHARYDWRHDVWLSSRLRRELSRCVHAAELRDGGFAEHGTGRLAAARALCGVQQRCNGHARLAAARLPAGRRIEREPPLPRLLQGDVPVGHPERRRGTHVEWIAYAALRLHCFKRHVECECVPYQRAVR